MNELIEQLSEKFRELYPGTRHIMSDRYATKYVSEVIKELRYREFLATIHRDTGEWLWAADKVKEACGQLKFGKNKHWIYSLFQKHDELRLVEVIKTGTSFTGLSKVIPSLTYRKHIMEELRSYQELRAISEEHQLTDYNYLVPVDIKSLEEYLMSTEETLRKTFRSTSYTEKLTRNLKMGHWIRGAVLTDETGSYLPERRTVSESGRTYAEGINTQSVSKELRHAILGHCHEYDIRAGSFAVLTALAIELNPAIPHDTLRSYVKNRVQLREAMATLLKIPVKTAKQIFTAIGFGATIAANPYTAIGRILTAEQIGTLRSWDTWNRLIEEFEGVKQECLKFIEQVGDELVIGYAKYSHTLPDGTVRRPAQQIAWLYQALETFHMDRVRDALPAECVRLTEVHDCVYTSVAIPNKVLVDLQLALSESTHGLVKLDHQVRYPIHRNEVDPYQDEQQELNRHLERIRQEELRAMNYEPKFTGLTIEPRTYHQNLDYQLREYFREQEKLASE